MKKRSEVIQDQIDEIMDTFDFVKVHEIMDALKWTYSDAEGIPDESTLRTTARKHLKEVAKNGGYSSSGGFTASLREGEDDGKPWISLHLYFGEEISLDGQFYEKE